MAIGAPTLSASFNTAGTANGSNAWKEITLTVAVGDRLVAFGLGENYNGGPANHVVTVPAGPGAVAGGWTYGKAAGGTLNDCSAYMAYGTVTTAGSITLRIQVDLPTSGNHMGVGVWRILAADVGTNPRYVIINGTDTDGRSPLTLTAISDVLTAIADWNAGALFGTTTLPAGGTVDLNSGTPGTTYTVWAARQLSQPTGTAVSYGPGGSPSGRDVAGVWFVQDTVTGGGGGSYPLAAIVAALTTITAAITASHPIGATVVVVSTVAAAIGVTTAPKDLAATIPVVSTVVAGITAAHPITAVVPVVSTVVAGLTASHPIAATIPVVSTVAADIVKAPPTSLTAIITVVSSSTATLALRANVSATIPIVTAVSGTIALKRSVSAILSITSTVSAAFQGAAILAALIPIYSTVSAAIGIYKPPAQPARGRVYGPDPDTVLSSSAHHSAVVRRPGRSAER